MQVVEGHRQSCRRELLWIGLLALILAAVFGRTLYADFVQWDDDINIYDNPGIRGLEVKNLIWMFTDASYVRRYMPLGWLSWTLLYEGCGLTPAAFHLANLVLHWLNSVLVFLVLDHLLRAAVGELSGRERRAQALWAAAAGALLRIGVNGIICFSSYALTLSSQAGFLIAGGSFLAGIIYALMKLLGFPFPMGNPTIVILILFMGGIQLISVRIKSKQRRVQRRKIYRPPGLP